VGVPNIETTISFQLDKSAEVSIKVYNVAGQLVEWLVQQQTFNQANRLFVGMVEIARER